MNVRLMSFNTQHCLNFKTGRIDFDLMADTVKSLGGEIIGLQEIRGEGVWEDYTDQTKALAERTGYGCYFAKAIDVGGVPNPYGNAILSKYPILSAETVMIPDPDPLPVNHTVETRCILKAVIDVGVPLTVLVTHFGLSQEEQQCAAEAALAQIKTEKCVLMGDFNITPEDPLIQRIRARMFDTAALFQAPRLSYPSDAPVCKIDYLFTSGDLNAVAADIPAVVASDHRPYICDIEI